MITGQYKTMCVCEAGRFNVRLKNFFYNTISEYEALYYGVQLGSTTMRCMKTSQYNEM